MNVHALVHARIADALQALQADGVLPAGLDLANVEVAPPRDAARGDLACNVALVLAKAAGLSPRQIAERLAQRLRVRADIESVEVAGAGFLNLRLAPRVWYGVVAAILEEGGAYGRVDLGRGERVNVAYVSPNPTGPLHAGHCRGAVFADTLARLLAFTGYDVTREVCIDDAGGVLLGDVPAPTTVGEAAVAAMLAAARKDLAALNVRPDVLYSARSLTAGADDHRNKLGRGFKHLISVLGAGHAGDLPRVQAAVMAVSGGVADVDVKVCQPLRLLRAGAPVRVSRPAGALVTLRDVVDEVGCDAVRFMMLCRRNDAPLDLDLAKVLEPSKDNPVFYVQYAHARAKSVFRNVQAVFPELQEGAAAVVGSDLSLLADAGEIDLIKQLALFPSLVEGAARAREPHRLAFYVYDLAASFDNQHTRGNDLPHLRFIQPADGKLTAARLALVQANAKVLALGLELLGVFAPLEMR